jgi:hypothetical protein
LEELLKSEKFTSRKKSYDFYFLSESLRIFREIRENELSSYASELEELKLDLGGYLRENQSSEIAGELNRIDAVVQDFITDIEVQNLRKAQESVPFAREKYEADKVLEVSDKVSELKKTHLIITLISPFGIRSNLSPYTTL